MKLVMVLYKDGTLGVCCNLNAPDHKTSGAEKRSHGLIDERDFEGAWLL